jgi:hypothetical protein
MIGWVTCEAIGRAVDDRIGCRDGDTVGNGMVSI